MKFDTDINKILETKKFSFRCMECGHEYTDYIRPGADKCPACNSNAKARGEFLIVK